MKIRPVKTADFSAVFQLIKELALFEKESEAVAITEDELIQDFKKGLFNCLVATHEDVVVGMALYYQRYSTWKGKTLHLEDLIVTQSARGKGIGKALLTSLIGIAQEQNVRRLEWCVLDWNKDAIAFYEQTGAHILKDWYLVQMAYRNSFLHY